MAIMKDVPAYTLGGLGLSFPAWAQFLEQGWTALIGFLGFAVLVLTIYNKILELRQRRRDLRDDHL